MSLQITPPYDEYRDIDGMPLENGKIYIGKGGLDAETNPTDIYWDEALTIPAPQPIRTIAGRVVNTGSPSAFYTNSESYSITVRDKNDVFIEQNLLTLGIAPGGVIGTNNIVDGAITTIKLADGAVTAAKLDQDVVITLDTIAAIKALTAGEYLAANLRESGRDGMFKWDGGNFSSNVTIDMLNGIYIPPDSDPTGATGAWVRQYDGRISPLWFGLAGDGDGVGGGTNDAVGMQVVLNSLTAGDVLRGGNEWFRIDTPLVYPSFDHIVIDNIRIDFSNAATAATLFTTPFVYGSDNLLTGDLPIDSPTIPITDATGIVKGDVLKLQDARIWTSGGSYYSELVTVRSVAGNNVTLYANTRYAYTTANTAKIQKIPLIKTNKIVNCEFIGSGASGEQVGLIIKGHRDIILENNIFEFFDDRMVHFEECVNMIVSENEFNGANMTGLGYGVTGGSCLAINVKNNFFTDCRHGTALGGESGIWHDITVDSNTGVGSDAQMFDCHPATDGTRIINNDITTPNTGSEKAAIICQGVNNVIKNNKIIGARTNAAIFVQTAVLEDNDSSSIVSGNKIENRTTTGIGIFIQAEQAGKSSGISIYGNSIQGGLDGIQIHAKSSDIDNVKIDNNTINDISGRSIFLLTASGTSIVGGTITGNVCNKLLDDSENIYLAGIDAQSIEGFVVDSNTTLNGWYGIRVLNGLDVGVNGNNIRSASVAKTLITGTNVVVSNTV